MARLTASVGVNGGNKQPDVMVVQTLLNTQYFLGGLLSGPPLVLTGTADEATIKMIREFQKKVLGHAAPTGRIEPGSDDLIYLGRSPKEMTEKALLRNGGFVDLYVMPIDLAGHGVVKDPDTGKYRGRTDPTFYEMHLPNARLVHDLEDMLRMADKVTEGGRLKIRKLRIGSHGGTYWFYIGSNEISLEKIDGGHLPKLHTISKYLVRGFSSVTIDACQTGMDKKLVRRLSTIWGGVAVKAFLDYQYSEPEGSKDNGAYVICGDRCTYGIGFEIPDLKEVVGFLKGNGLLPFL